MIFLSRAPNLWVSINLGGEHKSIRFENGRLNTAVAARKTGIPEQTIIQKLKEDRYYGVRFWEQQEGPKLGPGSSGESESMASYRELVEKAQALGIPYVGVKREILAEQVRQAEALLGQGQA